MDEPGTCGTWFPPPPFVDDLGLLHVVRLEAAETVRWAELVATLGEFGEVELWTELHDVAREGSCFSRLHGGLAPGVFQTVTTVPDAAGAGTTVVVERGPAASYVRDLGERVGADDGYPRISFVTERCTLALCPDPGGIDVRATDLSVGERFVARYRERAARPATGPDALR